MRRVFDLAPLLFGNGSQHEDGFVSPVFWLLVVLMAVLIILDKIVDILRNIKDYV